MHVTTTTASNATTIKVTGYWVEQRQPHYSSYPWFNDPIKLCDGLAFAYHLCSHDPLPPRSDKEAWAGLDTYFLPSMKLEKKGWQSISVGAYSRYEYEVISKWAKENKTLVYMSPENVDREIHAIIGSTEDRCFCLTVHPGMLEITRELLDVFVNARPCMLLMSKSKRIGPKMRAMLPENHRIARGEMGVAVSFAAVSNDLYSELIERFT